MLVELSAKICQALVLERIENHHGIDCRRHLNSSALTRAVHRFQQVAAQGIRQHVRDFDVTEISNQCCGAAKIDHAIVFRAPG